MGEEKGGRKRACKLRMPREPHKQRHGISNLVRRLVDIRDGLAGREELVGGGHQLLDHLGHGFVRRIAVQRLEGGRG